MEALKYILLCMKKVLISMTLRSDEYRSFTATEIAHETRSSTSSTLRERREMEHFVFYEIIVLPSTAITRSAATVQQARQESSQIDYYRAPMYEHEQCMYFYFVILAQCCRYK